MFIQMFIVMIVSLYSSRLLLRNLGVSDYGVLNVVAGVMSFIGFMTSSLSTASSRFITFELGKGTSDTTSRMFGNIQTIMVIYSLFFLILAETVGLWFVLNKLVIPADRLRAAVWIFQFSILGSLINILSVPYSAVIIAYERISTFAYISVLMTVLKLVIIISLPFIPVDRLVTYGFLLLIASLAERILYNVYTLRHFPEIRTRMCYDKGTFRELFSFAGWTMGRNLAVIFSNQGLDILINLFFGPVMNAARGISSTVQNVVINFGGNLQVPMNPQITKSYASGDQQWMHKLIIYSSKFSYYLLLVVILPIFFEADFLLDIWLVDVPDHSVNFVRIVIWLALLGTLTTPLRVSIYATGDVKKYQILDSFWLLMVLPVAYLLLKFFHAPVESVLIVLLVTELLACCTRIGVVLPKIKFPFSEYCKRIIIPIALVSILSPLIPFIVYKAFAQTGWSSFFVVSSVSLTCTAAIAYYLGCNKDEKEFFLRLLTKIIKGSPRGNQFESLS